MDQIAQDNFTVEVTQTAQEPTQTFAAPEEGVTYFESTKDGGFKQVGVEPQAPAAPVVAEQPVAEAPVPTPDPVQLTQPQAEKPGYIPVRDPQTGQFVTWIANDPNVISEQIFRKDAYIADLHRQLRSQPQTVQQPVVQQQAPPAPSPINKDALRSQLAPLAAQKFGADAEVGPLADFVAEALEKALTPAQQEIERLRQTNEQQMLANQYQREIAQIKAVDQRFDPNDPVVIQFRQAYPNYSPVQIHKEILYAEAQARLQNPAPATPTAPPAPPAPQPVKPSVPPQMFQTPNGSAPAAAHAVDSDPNVIEAVRAYEANCRYNGKSPTEEGRRMVRSMAARMRTATPEDSVVLRTN